MSSSLSSLPILLHIVASSLFTMNVLIMQIVVARILQRIPAGDLRRKINSHLDVTWRRWMGVIILVLALTAFFLLYTRWEMIWNSPYYFWKALTGTFTITLALSNHFVFRYWKKKRMLAAGEDERVKKGYQRTSRWIEKATLAGALLTYVMAILFHHG